MKKEILKTLKLHLGNLYQWENDDDVRDDIISLKAQIEYLEEEIRIDAHRDYVARMKEFRKHMSDTYYVLMDDDATDESCTEFYQSQFQITWRGKTITLDNSATVFQNIDDLLEIEIDENEVI